MPGVPADAHATRGRNVQQSSRGPRERRSFASFVPFPGTRSAWRRVMILLGNRLARGVRGISAVVVSATLACAGCGDESTLVARNASAQSDAAASVDSACSGKSCASHDGSVPDVATDEPCPSPPILPQGTSCPTPGTTCKAGLGDDPSLFDLCTCTGPSRKAIWQCQEEATSPADASLADASNAEDAVTTESGQDSIATGDGGSTADAAQSLDATDEGCRPGSTQCSNGNGTGGCGFPLCALETCGTDGHWGPAIECPAGCSTGQCGMAP